MIDYVTLIFTAAKATAVPPLLLLSVCFTESSLREEAFVPKDGATASYGLCQLKLKTARMYEPGIKRSELMSPYINARIAGQYLRDLLDRYNFNVRKAVDAYNRGHAALKQGRSAYSDRVLSNMRRKPWNRKFPSARHLQS